MLHKRILFIIALFLFTSQIEAQPFTVQGIITDSSANTYEANAVISILRQTDSTLVKFTRSEPSGRFILHDLQKGKYLILITYPKYADYVERFELGSTPVYDFKNISLSKKATLLKEIIVTQSAIRIKGDTTEYKADSFRVKPNASVEDLLKELPGIQVDRQGKIIAHGQTVQKILVDGEEFFSDDPTIASRNLRADAVDKVQVFDKKSDQSSFTGIDDGQTTKTINLELKDNAKNGYFGKLAAAALNEYYNGQAFINSFKAKRKLSAFIVTSSTEKTGLDVDESMAYGVDNDNINIDEGSGAIIIGSAGGGENLGTENYVGEGLPESLKGGLYFSNSWNGDVVKTNGNYLFNKLKEHGLENSFRQNTLKDSVYYNRVEVDNYSDKQRHALAAIFETRLDSTSSLKISANGYAGIFKTRNKYETEALTQENSRANSSIRKTNTSGDNFLLYADVLYRKRFKKHGRTVSVNLNSRLHQLNSTGYLQNESNFYLNNLPQEFTDQHKKNKGNQNMLEGTVTYTEALSSRSFIELNYSYKINNSQLKRQTFNKDNNSKYSMLVDTLSSDFNFNVNTHSAGINYRFNEKKYYFSFGGNIANPQFNQKNLVQDTSYQYDRINLFPQAVFNYKFNPYSNFNLKYTGITNQPSIHQLQPINNNNDPLNIIIGNPDLEEEFENTIQMVYSNYQVMNERYLILSSFLIHTSNMISSSYRVDSDGRSIYQTVNSDDGFVVSLGGGYSIKIPKTNVRLALGPSFSHSIYSNFINGLKNTTNTTQLLLRVNAKLATKDNYDFFATFIPSYNKSTATISAASVTNFTNYNFNMGGNILLPAKFEIGGDVDINIREKVNKFDLNNNVVLLNAYVEKKFLKDDLLTVRFSINDILDQNKGYDRYIYPLYSEERTYLTFRRYGLIGLTYNFVKKGTKMATEDGTIRL